MGKAGRKRKTGVKRVNGRISQRKTDVVFRHQETEQAATETARQARVRLFGISEGDAMNPDTATVVGRLKRSRSINAAQLKAAYRYEACVLAYHAAIGAPKGEGIRSGLAAEYLASEEERYRHAKARYEGAVAAINRENALHVNRGSNFHGALQAIIMRDLDLPHLYGDLRLALNVLVHYFGCADDDSEEARAAA